MTTAIAARATATIRKSFSGIEWKAESEGLFRATIASLNVVDKDGEVTVPGAFPVGKEIPISAYGHTSWDGALPVGKAVVGADQKTAWVEGQLFLDTAAGGDTFKVLKALGPMGEWSYGFRATQTSTDEEALAAFPGAWRILQQLDVFEASPVLLGAGINTGTQWVKSGLSLRDHEAAALESVASLVERWKALVASLRKEGRAISSERRERIAKDADSLEEYATGASAVATDLRALLEETDPSRDDGKAALQRLIRDTELDIIHRRVIAA